MRGEAVLVVSKVEEEERPESKSERLVAVAWRLPRQNKTEKCRDIQISLRRYQYSQEFVS